MKRLGQLLIELGWISGDDLARALRSQDVLGGRLGTCLLESGAVTEEQLTNALANQLGTEAARVRDLQNVPPEVYGLLPAKVALRLQAVPFRMLGSEIYVAMLDVHNLAHHDEIAFATNKSVRPHVVHEIRLYEALGSYYGLESPARFTQLLARLDENGGAPLEPTAKMTAGEQAALAPVLSDIGVTAPVLPVVRGEPSSPQEVADQLAALDAPDGDLVPRANKEADTHPAAEPPPSRRGEQYDTHGGFDGAETSDPGPQDPDGDGAVTGLSEASDRNEVASKVLAHLRSHFEVVALFMVKRERVRGWVGSGERLDQTRLKELELGLDQPSVFLNLRAGGLFFAGPLPPMSSHLEMAKCWGGDLPRQCLVLPVRIGGRLVTAILCDPGPGRGLAHIDIEHMNRVANQMGSALESCIVRSKRLSDGRLAH